MNTYHSLPLPVISVIDAKFASKLASYGLDFANALTVTKQAMMARMINSLIAMYHFSFYDGDICTRSKQKKLSATQMLLQAESTLQKLL